MFNVLKKFITNEAATPPQGIMLQCRATVRPNSVKRYMENDKEYISISSATLPDNIVMNGILYPAQEIEKSYQSLAGTLAPVEHPEINGEYISATDPRALSEYFVGAWNEKVTRENGRVFIEKRIDVAQAMKSKRGRDLLDKIAEIETNENAAPIHTSVGVFLLLDELTEPKVNDQGLEYFAVAKDMVFDHDAILLYSTGAAVPEQGVGVAVNKKGVKFKVAKAQLQNNGMSLSDAHKAVYEALERTGIRPDYLEEVFTDSVVYYQGEQLFQVPYTMGEDGRATVVGLPMPVAKKVSYEIRNNTINEDEGDMKELILNALKAKGIETDGLSDDELLAKYNEATQAPVAQSEGGETDDAVAALAKSVDALSEKITAMEGSIAANADSKKEQHIKTIVNSGQYAGLSEEDLKMLDLSKLESLAANCAQSYGVSPVFAGNSQDDAHDYDMPA